MVCCRLSKQEHISGREICEGVEHRGTCRVVASCAEDVQDTWAQEGVVECLGSCHCDCWLSDGQRVRECLPWESSWPGEREE